MQHLINCAQDIFLFFISQLGENFISKPLSQKIQITRSFLSVIAAIADTLKKDILLQKAAKTFDIPFISLKEELNKSTAQGTPSAPVTAPETISQTETISLLEKRIFCAIMN